jgi:nucleolar protein 12
MEKTLRVDRLMKGLDEDGRPKLASLHDYSTTIFIGNMPFNTTEEEVREHFTACGKLKNVRLVRDNKTFLGKGIGYVQFEEKTDMRKAIDSLHDQDFKGRKLRIKKAVEPKRLAKKERKKQERADEYK